MEGVQAYENQYINRINNLLSYNKERDYLSGYYYFVSSHLSYSSAYRYLKHVINFMDRCNKNPEDLMLDDYSEYMTAIRSKTSSYQIAVYSALKSFSEYLLASDRNKLDPMRHAKRPKAIESQKTIQKRDNGYLSKEELPIYLQAVKSESGLRTPGSVRKQWHIRDELIIQIFLVTGIRCSALYKLDVSSIDFQKGTISVTEKRDYPRILVLPEEILQLTKEWLGNRQGLLNNKEENALFVSNRGTRMDQTSISRVVSKYAKNIHGKNITPHKLRATYGTILYGDTKDVYFVQQMMGHTSPKTTEMYIRGQQDTNGQKAADIMSKITMKK